MTSKLRPGMWIGAAVGAVIVVALVVWRIELFPVAAPMREPAPLRIAELSERRPVELDVVLPVVPAGMRRLHGGGRALLVHYWAPWQRHARDQARLLDSLAQRSELGGLDIAVVCFDPFPSVTRFVTRQRLRLLVLLDGEKRLRRTLPCPRIPFTYVLDAGGRVAAAQPGEIAWLATATREALARLAAEDAGLVSALDNPKAPAQERAYDSR
jgi:hypothetical protein